MTLDREEHRTILLQMMDAATFGGALRKLIAELGEAIEKAEVKAPEQKEAP